MAISFTDLVVGFSSFLSAAKSIKKGLGIVDGPSAPPRRRQGLAQTVDLPDADGSPMKVTVHEVKTIEERLKYVVGMIKKGRDDPRVRAFTTKLLSRKCGKEWCVPEKNWLAECHTIYNAVREHVRYVRDTFGKDLFQHPMRTLEFRSADCFPRGTLVVTRDGLEEIQNLKPGDEIHDGETWVKVIETWDRGPKEVLRFELNNGCMLSLSDTHKVLRVPRSGGCPGVYDGAEEVMAGELVVGNDLLQPRRFDAASSEEIDDDDAFMIGAYLAEGCRVNHGSGAHREVSLAGVADSKMIRERATAILQKRGIKFHAYERDLRFSADDFTALYHLGRTAINKHLPTFRYGPKTVAAIVQAMEMGDGGMARKNLVYSTISYTLALHYRVLQRMLGRSVSINRVDEHGGFGSHPIYRVTVRNEDVRRPWAKISAIWSAGEQDCYDIMTESGRVYLPEADVITRQCDDFTILLGSMFQSVGYPVKCRVVRTKQAREWDHIYLMVLLPPRGGPDAKWMAADASVDAEFGWEAPAEMIAQHRDFVVD